jgi:hypothetical protein
MLIWRAFRFARKGRELLRFVDQGHLANRICDHRRRTFGVCRGWMPLSIAEVTCQRCDSRKELSPILAKSSAEPEAAITDSPGVGPEHTLQRVAEALSC